MENLINELKNCLINGLYLTSLNTALIIPDICSALESENGKTTGVKYKNWFNTYVSNKYHGMLSGDDAWKLRCASLHQGSYNHNYQNFEKIIFQIPKENLYIHCNIINNCLSLDISIFINDILEGVVVWENDMKENDYYQINLENSFKYNPEGLVPYINIPVFA